jgi:hypothetical protein
MARRWLRNAAIAQESSCRTAGHRADVPEAFAARLRTSALKVKPASLREENDMAAKRLVWPEFNSKGEKLAHGS